MKEKLKVISVTFFRYWWNRPGNNTDDAFDTWYDDHKEWIEQVLSQQAESIAHTFQNGKRSDEDCLKMAEKYVQDQQPTDVDIGLEIIQKLQNITDALYAIETAIRQK